jgi:hypothetical protein
MDAQAKEIKNKFMCEIISFAIVYFFLCNKLAHVLLIDNLLITSLIPILLFEHFNEKS